MTKVVIVIGCGRSGTSLLCQVLEAMGVWFGDEGDLIGPWAINERGQYEHIGIQTFHRGLMADVFGVSTWLWSGALDPGWEHSTAVAPYREALRDRLALEMREASDRGTIFGFKDARTTRLLPLWRAILKELEVEPVWLLTWRHPRAVYRSLVDAGKRLGMPPAGSSEDDVLAIWAEFMADAFALGEDLAAVVNYDRWFTDGSAQAQQVATAIRRNPLTAERLASIVSPQLRHHRR